MVDMKDTKRLEHWISPADGDYLSDADASLSCSAGPISLIPVFLRDLPPLEFSLQPQTDTAQDAMDGALTLRILMFLPWW